MSRIIVESDDGMVRVEIVTDEDGWTTGRCSEHPDMEEITDRGHFEDTIQAAQLHIFHHHE